MGVGVGVGGGGVAGQAPLWGEGRLGRVRRREARIRCPLPSSFPPLSVSLSVSLCLSLSLCLSVSLSLCLSVSLSRIHTHQVLQLEHVAPRALQARIHLRF